MLFSWQHYCRCCCCWSVVCRLLFRILGEKATSRASNSNVAPGNSFSAATWHFYKCRNMSLCSKTRLSGVGAEPSAKQRPHRSTGNLQSVTFFQNTQPQRCGLSHCCCCCCLLSEIFYCHCGLCCLCCFYFWRILVVQSLSLAVERSQNHVRLSRRV